MTRKGGMSWIEGTGVAAGDQATFLVLFCVPTGTVLTARRSAGKSMMSDVRISDGHEAFPCHRVKSDGDGWASSTANRSADDLAWLFVAIKPFSVKAYISLEI